MPLSVVVSVMNETVLIIVCLKPIFFRNFMHLIVSGEDTGRVLKYNPETKETTTLLRNLQFPNGLSLGRDGSFFIFCEGSIGR